MTLSPLYVFLNRLYRAFSAVGLVERKHLGGYRISIPSSLPNLQLVISAVNEICPPDEDLSRKPGNKKEGKGFHLYLSITMDERGCVQFDIVISPVTGSWFSVYMENHTNRRVIGLEDALVHYETLNKRKI